jgi:serine/threonine protein phosphatase PrpC
MSNPNTPTLWRVAGKRVRGATHARAGKPCQDAIDWWERDGVVVLSVADGHGSERSPHSDKGARIAVDAALHALCYLYANSGFENLTAFKRYAEEQLPRALVRDWTERVLAYHTANEDTAGEGEAPAEPVREGNAPAEPKGSAGASPSPTGDDVLVQYGTTLLAALASPEFLLFLQLGDGDILVVSDDGTVARPIPKDARLMANETTSLCTPHAWREVRVVFQPIVQQPPALILVSTDGYANSFISEQEFLKVGPDYLRFIREEGLEQVASHLEEWLSEAAEQGSGDDVTLGIICRRDLVA